MRGLVAGVAEMIRIDALWLATAPVDMRAGPERLLARVVQVFGCAQAHHGYLFANARASRIKPCLSGCHRHPEILAINWEIRDKSAKKLV